MQEACTAGVVEQMVEVVHRCRQKGPADCLRGLLGVNEFLLKLYLFHGPHVAPQLGTYCLNNGIANCLIDIYKIKIVDGAVLKI